MNVKSSEVLVLSPYTEDIDCFNTVSSIKINFKLFTTTDKLLSFLSESNSSFLILVSSKIEDAEYMDVIGAVLDISKINKIIVYSKYTSIQEVSYAMQKGAYHFSVGDNVYSDAVNCVERLFSQLDDSHSLNKSIDSVNLLEIFNNLEKHVDSDFKKQLHTRFDKWNNNIQQKYSEKVLIVEDEVMYLEFLQQILSSKYTVAGVGLAKDAIVECSNAFYPVILVDLFLPDKDGVQLVSELKKLSPLSEIIVITAFDLPDSASEVFELGIYDYLNKPILKERLFESLEGALKQSKQRVLEDNLIHNFFSIQLTFDEKITFIDLIHKLKLEQNEKLFLEDLVCFFPEFKVKNFPNNMPLPLFGSKGQLEMYLQGLIKS